MLRALAFAPCLSLPVVLGVIRRLLLEFLRKATDLWLRELCKQGGSDRCGETRVAAVDFLELVEETVDRGLVESPPGTL
jgi:hypothetical protein